MTLTFGQALPVLVGRVLKYESLPRHVKLHIQGAKEIKDKRLRHSLT